MPGDASRLPGGGQAQGFPRPFGSKYQLLQHLATGGMADVFLARQIGGAGFVKECVIKRILPHLAGDQQFVTMFLDEARLCARLNHPNIAQVYDHGKIGDDYFMAMEYVDGVDLEQVLDTAYRRGEKRIPFPIAARVIAGVAEGLAHAHAAVDEHGVPLGLVHRDVTPSNIALSFEGVPKLLDFGVAKAASKQNKTEVGIIKGKVPYMSPEQVQGEPLDGRSDLFALGAILYELTTGDKPFQGENGAAIGVRIMHDEPTPPSLVVADFPEELESIIMAALAKRPNDRTPSARALQMQLERFLVNSRAPVTSYDVAHYLSERFERKRISAMAVVAAPAGSRGENVSMSSEDHKREASEPLSIGDPSVLDLGASGRRDTRRSMGGGGGPWMAAAMLGLVVAVGVGFLFLRTQEQKKEEAAQSAVDASPGAVVAQPTPPPPTPIAPTPTVPPANPVPTAALTPPPAPAPTTNVLPPPAPAPVPTTPTVTPLVAPETHKPAPVPRPHHTSSAPHKEHDTSAPSHSLPTLPQLPTDVQ